jgi:two-component system sensor histidine kinase KdpD
VVADRVDDALQDYRERHGITRPWETRERIVVALAGAPDTDHLIRRAARIAQRTKGDLIGVHVVSDSGLTSGNTAASETAAAQRRLLEELGGEYRRVTSNDVAAALVILARAENATQIVLGATGRSRWQELFGGSVTNRVVRLSGPIDVHVISDHQTQMGRVNAVCRRCARC